jgi:hypothetical protein
MSLSRHTFLLAASAAFYIACSSSKPTVYAGNDGGTGTTSCGSAATLGDSDFCSMCQFSAGAAQTSCKSPRVVDACCVYTAAPSAEVARGTGLHYFSSTDATVDLGCLSAPATAGASKTITLKGNVRLFSSGNDSANVKIEIYKQGDNGALGALVGAAFTTSSDDVKDPAITETWSTKCPTEGCKLRSYSYANVPTETPLIIKTSDASGSASQWSDLYDYNVYVANSVVGTDNTATYNPSAVASTDVNTVASAAGGFTIDPTKGVLAGEVHDCSDVRLAGAMVDTDVAHESDVFYFGENEADPLPDASRAQQGTSHLGLFGMLNLAAGQPIRISAVGISGGQTVLLGTYTVQTFPGAVTALSFRGRRPFQK